MRDDEDTLPTPEGYEQAFAWFQRLIDAPDDERERLLTQAEAEHPALRQELEELLALHQADDRKVAASVEAEVVAFADGSKRLTRIGRYQILHKIADGGMGTVYLAEQEQPRRKVALKVIRGGVATPDMLRRFELEAELLGTLDHPGIATIYEAGTERTPLGPLPFLAMEYVEGAAIDEYAKGLGVREKLHLVAELADAIQHAHRKAIVHRDLKPANVLVDEKGQPKVLDFGVARLQEEDRTLTAQGQVVGTLPYMSPEQVRGDSAAIDTRTDVYALGAIAYELFTGGPPHDLTGKPLTAAARTILETDAKRLGSSDARLRGDVETIVAKALAKEPDRRYPSAEALAADIRRHLNDEPIEARPTSAFYVLTKFARRHKAPVAAAALVLLALVGGLIATTTLATREARQRARADRKAEEAARETYRAQIAAADAAVQVPDLSAARRFLEAVPEARRQWEWRYLHARLDDSAGTIQAADPAARGWLLGLAVSRDGTVTTLHTGRVGKRPTVRVQRRETNAPVVHELAAGHWRLAPDGSHVSRLQEGKAWIHAVGEPRGRSLLADRTVFAVLGFDPEAKRVLAATKTHFVLADVATGTAVREWPLGPGVTEFAFCPCDGRFAIAGDRDIRVFDPGSEQVRVLEGHEARVRGLAFSPRGKRLVSVDVTGTLRLWTLEGGHLLEARAGRRDEHGPLAFGPDGRFVVGAFADGTLRILEASTLIERARLAGRSDQRATLPPVFHEHTVVTGRRDGTIQRFPLDLAEGHAVLDAHRGGATSVAFASDGRRLATAGADGFVRIWDVPTEQPIGSIDLTLDRMPLGNRLIESVAFRDDGASIEALAVTARGRTRLRYDAYSARALSSQPERTDRPHADLLHETRGQRLLRRSDGQDPPRWSVRLVDETTTATLFEGAQRPLQAARTGDALYLLFDDGVLRTFDAGGLEPVASLDLSQWRPAGFALLDGGARFLVRTADPALLVFDPTSDTPVLALRGHGGAVVDVDVSPDGQQVASASADGTVRLWRPDGRGARYFARAARRGRATQTERLIAAATEAAGDDLASLPTHLRTTGTFPDAVRTDALDRTFGLAAAHASRGDTQRASSEQFERRYEVKVDDVGATPRRRLAYAANATPVRLEIQEVATLRMALGGLRFPETKIPSRTIALRFDRVREGNGVVLAEIVVETFELPRHPMVAQMQEGLPDMAQVTGARLRVRMPRHGAWRVLQVADADLEPTEVLRILEVVDQAFSDTMPPLPPQPVGAGAAWRVIETERVMGVDVRTVRSYTVTGFEGDVAQLAFTTERRAPKQDIEAPTAASQTRMTLTAFESRAKGTARFAPGLPLLEHVALEARQHVAADVDTRGVKQSTSLDLEGSLEAKVERTE